MASKVYLLSISDWEEYGFASTNIDAKKLKPIILRVQRQFIEPVLGTTLYNKMIDDAPNFTGIYATLMEDYLSDTILAYCDWKATFHTTNQITNKTTGS